MSALMLRKRGLLAAFIAAYLLATTYPYSIDLNGAEFDEDSIVFESPGYLRWSGPQIDYSLDRIRVALKVRTDKPDQDGPARIFTISRDEYHSNLTIGQENDALVVRLRRRNNDPLGEPAFVVEGVFSEPGKVVDIEVDLQRTDFTVFVDDQIRSGQIFAVSPVHAWDGDFRLGIGNEHTLQRPWLGEILAASLVTGDREFDLLAPDVLRRPSFVERLSERVTLLSLDVGDWIANFVFLIPLGFLTASAIPRRPVRNTAIVWIVLPSLAELIQVFLPDRITSISDVTLNWLGAVTGACLYVYVRQGRWHLVRPS